MRIAIDARELCGRPTGVGRYLAHLLRAWSGLQAAREHQFDLYVPAARAAGDWPSAPTARPALTAPCLPDMNGLRTRVVPVAGGGGTWWEQVHLAAAIRRDRPDVLFSPAYTAPLAAGVPIVVALHDISFIAHPEWYPPRTRLRRRLLATLSARRARRVLTISNFSKGELESRLAVPPGKIRVVLLGITVPAALLGGHAHSVDARQDPGDPAGRAPLVLFVGSIFNRRHLPELIEAFAEVAGRHPEMRLEIVGENRTYPPQDLPSIAARAGVGAVTSVRSYVPDAVLADLYTRAGVFVFLSDYEGFGLTPLEALAAGIPTIVADTPVAREIYGDGVAYVSARDTGAIAAQMERLLFDRPARSSLLQAAGAVLRRYSWSDAAAGTLGTLVEAARG